MEMTFRITKSNHNLDLPSPITEPCPSAAQGAPGVRVCEELEAEERTEKAFTQQI